MVNVPVRRGHSRNVGCRLARDASTTLSAADARLLQDRGGGAALAAPGRGRPRPPPLHALARARRRGRQGRAAHALARRRAARAVQPRRARAARGPRRAAHDLAASTRSRRTTRVREQPERARIAGACGEALLQDVRRGRSVAAGVRRALPPARRARRLRAAPRATSRSIRCCSPSSSSCTGWPDSPRGSPPARAARPRTCRSCASRRPPAAPCAAPARGGSPLPPGALEALAALLRAPLAEAAAAHPARRRDRRALRLRSQCRARRLPPALAGADGRRVSRFGQLVLVAAAATLATVLVRTLAGEALGSDAYSHLVWARDAVAPRRSPSHAPFDYTVPKPFAAGRRRDRDGARRADVRVRVGVTGRRLRVRRRGGGARHAGSGATRPRRSRRSSRFCLPVLWRGGPLGDSNVPYAALVVGGRRGRHGDDRRAPACSRVAGTLRPEAWGLAVINAVLGWRKATLATRVALGRLGGRAAGALDHARPRVHGRLVVVEQHRRRLQRALPAAAAASLRRCRAPSSSASATCRPGRSRCSRVAALAVGVKQRPFDAAVVFPVALVVALLVVVARGQISADDVGRMLTALAVFAAAGAAVALARAQRRRAAGLAGRGRGRGRAARGRALAGRRRARRARPVAPGPRAREGRRAGTRARGARRASSRSPRQWQGQLALSWDRPRSTFIPARVIGDRRTGSTSATSAR